MSLQTSDASDCSNTEDSGENYMDSDVKDEASDSGSCSPRDSDIGFKEKRRNRRYKDFDEENICKDFMTTSYPDLFFFSFDLFVHV